MDRFWNNLVPVVLRWATQGHHGPFVIYICDIGYLLTGIYWIYPVSCTFFMAELLRINTVFVCSALQTFRALFRNWHRLDGWLAGWMTWYLTYFLTLLHSERPKLYAILTFLSALGLTVFHLHKDDRKVIMKGCMQWNPVNAWKDFFIQGVSNLGLLDQKASIYSILIYQGSS